MSRTSRIPDRLFPVLCHSLSVVALNKMSCQKLVITVTLLLEVIGTTLDLHWRSCIYLCIHNDHILEVYILMRDFFFPAAFVTLVCVFVFSFNGESSKGREKEIYLKGV